MKNSNDLVNALIVDDNEVNLLVLSNMLEVYGVRTDKTDCGSAAADLCRENSYDFIFIDHLMPDMDGVQTTALIRRFSRNPFVIIIALSSEVTLLLCEQYKVVGADALYEKPLALTDIALILERWYPGSYNSNNIPKNNANICYGNNELIQSIIETIDDIDYSAGLKNAVQNPNLYIHILEVSLKDLQSCLKLITSSYENSKMNELKLGIHKLYNVYSHIGASSLAEESSMLEKAVFNNDRTILNNGFSSCMRHLESFMDKLQTAIDRYHSQNDLQIADNGSVCIPMSYDEYEQCLKKAIYYIRRYEYDAILSQMEQLVIRGALEDIPELENARRDVMDYDYENALKRLNTIKNKTGASPVREI